MRKVFVGLNTIHCIKPVMDSGIAFIAIIYVGTGAKFQLIGCEVCNGFSCLTGYELVNN